MRKFPAKRLEFPAPTSPHDFDCMFYHVANTYMKWHEFETIANNGDKYLSFYAIRAKASFEGCWDYSRGIVQLRIYTALNIFNDDKSKWHTRFQFTNIDDGGWVADNVYFDTIGECNAFTRKVYEEFKAWEESWYGNNLMPEKDINDFLMTLGLFGTVD